MQKIKKIINKTQLNNFIYNKFIYDIESLQNSKRLRHKYQNNKKL